MTSAEFWDLVVKATGLAGAAVAFGAGVWQYAKAQRWRRAEWVAQEVRSFEQDPLVRSAAMMIDWCERDVVLFTDGSGEKGEIVRVTDDMVAKALQHHRHRPKGFTKPEAAIRDSFDRFLDGLERFESFRSAGLVTAKDLKPYLAYWFHHIRSAKREDTEATRLVQLRSYVEEYGFRGVQRLFRCYSKEPLLSQESQDWYCSASAGNGESVPPLR